ncbi:hypothetical protein F1559_003435 [Cyanidiococcus yangmingshanensis]|uniref:Uncharacterized protein n=1 Tax=Cyanidiococcus yangmingshanensis TaxID=2690220 RepID=A0A7J7ILJ2_9RHOD|nr:hypothetical protein F1559_003435 [Cyanidiococcus yangmingshanensis]
MEKLFVVRVLQREDVQAELAQRGMLCAGTGAVTGLLAAAFRGYRVSTTVVMSSAGFTLAGVPFFALQRVFEERRKGTRDPWNSVFAGWLVGWFIALGISGPWRCPQGALTLAALSGTTHWLWTGVSHWRQRTAGQQTSASSAISISWPEWMPIQPVRPDHRPARLELSELLAKRAALEEEIRARKAHLTVNPTSAKEETGPASALCSDKSTI